jgi:hypothetical protein
MSIYFNRSSRGLSHPLNIHYYHEYKGRVYCHCYLIVDKCILHFGNIHID